MDKDCAKESLKFKNLWQSILYKIGFMRDNPTYFDADGLTIFVGAQGTGKTLSAVNYVYNLMEKYPKSKLVTNLMLKDYPIVTFDEFIKSYSVIIRKAYETNALSEDDRAYLFEQYKRYNRVFPFDNGDDLRIFENDIEGVIYLIDEIQLYFSSLESKNINPEVMVEFAQQRKQRKHFVATSQVFGRMAKPLREQFSSVVVCKNWFKYLQQNKLVDRDSIEESTNYMNVKGKCVKQWWWWHSPKMYGRYDTYYKISRTKFVSEEKKGVSIYDGNQLPRSS